MDKGSWVLHTFGNKLQHTLDESGVTQSVSGFVHSAADKTMQIGGQIKDKGTEKFEQVQETYPVVGTITEKSK